MKRTAAIAGALASLLFVFARSPEERTITDPASVTSTPNRNALPVPIDDLFFSRSVNKTVDSHIYPAEGHGFVKRESQIDAIKRTFDWFDRYLKPQ